MSLRNKEKKARNLKRGKYKDKLHMKLPSFTQEKLNKLAKEIVEGKVFTEAHIDPNSNMDLSLIFAVVIWMDKKQLEFMAKHKAFIYEYMDKSLPRGINGYPFFMSLRWMVQEDAIKVLDLAKEMEKILDNGKPDTQGI